MYDLEIKGLGWFVNIYLDACHSGSVVQQGIKWVKKHGGFEEGRVGKDFYHPVDRTEPRIGLI